MVNVKGSISIQKWVIMLLVPLMVTLMGFTINVVMANTTTKERVNINEVHIEKNTTDIEVLESQKVDKETINRVYNTLDRIENKLDQYILNND